MSRRNNNSSEYHSTKYIEKKFGGYIDEYELFSDVHNRRNPNDKIPKRKEEIDALNVNYIMFTLQREEVYQVRKDTMNRMIEILRPLVQFLYSIVSDLDFDTKIFLHTELEDRESYDEYLVGRDEDIAKSEMIKPRFFEVVRLYSEITDTPFEENKYDYCNLWDDLVKGVFLCRDDEDEDEDEDVENDEDDKDFIDVLYKRDTTLRMMMNSVCQNLVERYITKFSKEEMEKLKTFKPEDVDRIFTKTRRQVHEEGVERLMPYRGYVNN